MKRYLIILLAFFALATGSMTAAGVKTSKHTPKNVAGDASSLFHRKSHVKAQDIIVERVGDKMTVDFNLVLDSLYLKPNQQVFLTPSIQSADNTIDIPLGTIVLSGRNMHYVYLRSGKTKATAEQAKYDILREYYHKPGDKYTIMYHQAVPAADWMYGNGTHVTFSVDSCGCGRFFGNRIYNYVLPSVADRMMVMPFPVPDPTVRKPINHHGEARVQFEVNRTELHAEPYVCKSGQRIDNRAQLQVIDDSIRYALRDPNVEIESISICGYASPESPYDHNDYLATNRSRALSEYIAQKYSLPRERCHYSAVPENWAEFDTIVTKATDITEQQRADLLALIAQPCYGPSDYDAKEQTLKTDPRFAELYKNKILPEWFPRLRCTRFDIRTQLKPMDALQLRDVLAKSPELMSLDEIYMVANSYEHGSAEFQQAMKVALEQYPDDPVANGNAAAIAIEAKDYDLAEKYLAKAGDTDDANVLRGIVATAKGDLSKARILFRKAATTEARRNLMMIE